MGMGFLVMKMVLWLAPWRCKFFDYSYLLNISGRWRVQPANELALEGLCPFNPQILR